MDLGWKWTKPSRKHIEAAVQSQRAWWWHSRQGVLLLGEDSDHEDSKMPTVQLLACPLEILEELLTGYRQLADTLGYQQAGWTAPPEPRLVPLLERAGFVRTWDASVYVYTKKHPDQP